MAGVSRDHSTPVRAPLRVQLLLLAVLAPFFAATVIGLLVLWPHRPVRTAPEGIGLASDLVRATITGVVTEPCPGDEPGAEPEPDPLQPDPQQTDPGTPSEPGEDRTPPDVTCMEVTARLTNGKNAGQSVVFEVTQVEGAQGYRSQDKVVLAFQSDAPPDLQYRIVDRQRGPQLTVLAVMFAAAVVLLGRWRGLAALAGLAVSLAVLLKFVIPALLLGENPLAVALVGSSVLMFVALYLAHGFSVRTSTAVLGTLASLLLTVLLGWAFTGASQLSGLSSEEANFLQGAFGGVDPRGLLLAGVVIGALGVLDDVTVTQASAVWELRAANPAYSAWDLYRAAVRIGRDHIASTVNTLVLAYAGASLPLLLLFTISGTQLTDVLTSDIIATEVVRTLVGSIGLVASVPLTTGLAAVLATAPPSAGPPGRGRRRPARPTPPDEPDEHDEWITTLRNTPERTIRHRRR